jgi:hypothetical protein
MAASMINGLIARARAPVYWRSDVKLGPEPADEVSVELAVKHARAALHLG